MAPAAESSPESSPEPEGRPLTGRSVGVTAERRRAELGAALERRGADVVYGPAIHIGPLEDDTALREATERCLTAPLDFAIATTGVGFRGWVEAAGGWGVGDQLLATLGAAAVLTRGPKARGAVRAAGLRERWSPQSESSSEILEHLLADGSLAGARIAVQLHGEPLDDLVDGLQAAGADVITVPVYRWERPPDDAPLRHLITRVADATIDAVTFTSAPAATSFVRTSAQMGAEVRDAVTATVLCAAVGPVTAAPLQAAGIPVVWPERFRLGALVNLVADELARRPARDR